MEGEQDIHNFDSLLEAIVFLDKGGDNTGLSYQDYKDLGK